MSIARDETCGRLGIVMLCHTALDRAAEVARHWAEAGCPVAIHVDRATPRRAFRKMQTALADLSGVSLSRRFRCEWGGWGLVAASQEASARLLAAHPAVQHVLLTSGACLPLRPVRDLTGFLAARPDTDFIESATTADVPWTVGGLDIERFTLHFPFSWRRRRRLFDRCVRLQRRLGIARRLPPGIVPHLGSQWWCLTRRTLTAILDDPDRPRNDAYFRRVWIPDESYFQTLARRHARRIESRSLTLAKFDFQGRPHILYDDHLHLLRRSDRFVARKIWPGATRLYATFLTPPEAAPARLVAKPPRIDRVFARAAQRRTRGRAGLYSQSRFPNPGWENGLTAAPFAVFQGLPELFVDFAPWLSKAAGLEVHGRLFAPGGADFAQGGPVGPGALSAAPRLRDADPRSFLANLIRAGGDRPRAFQFHPADRARILPEIARDANASVFVVTGAWGVPLLRAGGDAGALRREAARLQKREAEMLYVLRDPQTRAQVRIWTLADFLDGPHAHLEDILSRLAPRRAARLRVAPDLVDLTGFSRAVARLENSGMHPYLMGDIASVALAQAPAASAEEPEDAARRRA